MGLDLNLKYNKQVFQTALQSSVGPSINTTVFIDTLWNSYKSTLQEYESRYASGTLMATFNSDLDMSVQVVGTLSQSEKEERQEENLIKPAPKKKPPRKDKQKHRVDETERDSDKEQDKKDRSNNDKNAGISRVATRYLLGKGELITVRNTETGKTTQVTKKTLQQDSSKYKEVKDKEVKDKDLTEEETQENIEPQEKETKEVDVERPKKEKTEKKQQPKRTKPKSTEVEDFGKQLLQDIQSDKQKRKEEAARQELRKPPSQSQVLQAVKEHGLEVFRKGRDMELDSIKSQVDSLQSVVKSLDPESTSYEEDSAKALATLGALRTLEVLKAGQDAEDVGPIMAMMVQTNIKGDNIDEEGISNLIMTDVFGQESEAGQQVQHMFRNTLDNIPPNELQYALPNGHPGKEIAELLSDDSDTGVGRFLTDEDKVQMGEWLKDMIQGEATFLDPAVKGKGKSVADASKDSASVYDSVGSEDLFDSESRTEFLAKTKSIKDKFLNTVGEKFLGWKGNDWVKSEQDYQNKLEERLNKLKGEQEQAIKELEKQREKAEKEQQQRLQQVSDKNSSLSSIESLYDIPIVSTTFNKYTKDRSMYKKQADNLVNYQERIKEFSVGDTVTFYGFGPQYMGRITKVHKGIGMLDVETASGNKRYPVEDVQKYEGNVAIPPYTESGRVAMVRRVALYWAQQNRQYKMNKSEVTSNKPYCPKCGPQYRLRKTNYKMRDGVCEKLLGCGNCLFLVKQDDILNK